MEGGECKGYPVDSRCVAPNLQMCVCVCVLELYNTILNVTKGQT